MADTTYVEAIPASVAAGLLRARRAVRAVEKDSKNEHHGYKYASAEDVMAEGLRACNEGGISFSCISWTVVQVERPRSIATESGSIETVIESVPRLRCMFLVCAEDGGCFTVTSDDAVLPGKGRPEDKAEFGMLTEAYAYALRGLLGMPRVDERISVSGRDDTGAEPARPGPRRAPPAARPLAPPAPANDAPPPAAPATGEVTYESNLVRRIRQARTPGEVQAALGACKEDLTAGHIDKETMRRLFALYQARNAELAPAEPGAAQ